MPHGQPDFGAYAAKTTVGSLADMAELASRLGSIVTLDRRGDVVFLEDFEAPILNWYCSSSIGEGTQRLYPDKAFMGSQSVYLASEDNVDDYSYISRRFHATPNQRYGMEARVYQLAANACFDVDPWFYTGSKVYKAEWRYDSENDLLRIWDSTGHWKTIATDIKALSTNEEWWPMKLVIDSLNWKYVRGLFLGVEYDLSDEAIEGTNSDVPPCLQPGVEVTNNTGTPTGALFDNIILTQNEP